MDIGLSIVVDLASDCKSDCMGRISDLMHDYFKDKHYGAINHYWIVCKAVRTISGFEKFSSVARPMYKTSQWYTELDGTRKKYIGVYSYGVKFDFEEYDHFISVSNEEAERMVARKVVESLANLDRLSKKAAAFDKERFKSDLIQLFYNHHLI